MRSPRDVHKSGSGGYDQFLQHVCRIFQGIIQGPRLPRNATTQQREDWTRHHRGAVVIDTEDINPDDKYSVMPLLIFPEDSDNDDYLSDPLSADPTPEPRHPSEKPTEEPTSEPDFGDLSEPDALKREDSMSNLAPKHIVI